jgi:anthranilate phosphoribosyltransferase
LAEQQSAEVAKLGDLGPSTWFAEAMAALLARRDLRDSQIRAAVSAMVLGQFVDVEAAAFLIALRLKGETAGEIAAAAGVLREHMLRWDPGPAAVLDTCGTGGDASGTFNISTATAFVVAAAGVPVVKHGNRAFSSRSGSIDVLVALGAAAASDPDRARRCLEKCGLAFCCAPYFHPALWELAPLRKRLGVPTLFNLLGPLANPAAAAYQLLGVGRANLLDPMAGALAILGTRRALVVCSRDGLDEISLSAPTLVREVLGNEIRVLEWTPEDFGLESCTLEELRAEGPEASAAMVRAVLHGQGGAAGRVVLANAAAALIAAERATSPREGVALAAEAVSSGRAARVLKDQIALSLLS